MFLKKVLSFAFIVSIANLSLTARAEFTPHVPVTSKATEASHPNRSKCDGTCRSNAGAGLLLEDSACGPDRVDFSKADGTRHIFSFSDRDRGRVVSQEGTDLKAYYDWGKDGFCHHFVDAKDQGREKSDKACGDDYYDWAEPAGVCHLYAGSGRDKGKQASTSCCPTRVPPENASQKTSPVKSGKSNNTGAK